MARMGSAVLIVAVIGWAAEDAQCASHAACTQLTPQDGLCCPVSDGTRLACCDDVPGSPPEQTETQKVIWLQKAAAAKEASEAATPDVLAFFESSEFREAISDCCPEVAVLQPREILDRYRAEVRAAELAHAFPASISSGSHFIDLTIAGALEYTWFINEVQARFLDYDNKTRFQNEIEESLFGCKPFAVDQHPTWSEAADRLIYVAHNMREIDTGSLPAFGDVTAVFDYEYVRNMVLIAPVDTGMYSGLCRGNRPWSKGDNERPNCSAWEGQVVGTLDHFDHLILPNLAFPYNSSVTNLTIFDGAKGLFSHSAFAGAYEDRPTISYSDMSNYWEPNILGNPSLPESVRFLVGNFVTIFGTMDGRKLQDLADYYAWPLFWAFGYGNLTAHSHDGTALGNERLMDPFHAMQHSNASIPLNASSNFEDVWSAAAAIRDANVNKTWTKEQISQIWAELKKGQLRVAPLTAASCADLQACVATAVGSGECICTPSAQTAIV